MLVPSLVVYEGMEEKIIPSCFEYFANVTYFAPKLTVLKMAITAGTDNCTEIYSKILVRIFGTSDEL